MPNQGESGELLLKASVVLAMYLGKEAGPLGKVLEANVGDLKSELGSYRYPLESAPEAIRQVCEDPGAYDSLQIKRKLQAARISKASNALKADIRVNGTYYSVKSADEKPAIINHTKRSGFLNAARIANYSLRALDENISRYWDLRLAHKIGEDVGLSSRKCFNLFWSTDFKEEFRFIFNYFAFDGTGRGASKLPATMILEYANPRQPRTWKTHSKNTFFEECWHGLVFSVRAKGQTSFTRDDLLWVRQSDGRDRGQLHVRVA